ncbi:MAG: histidine kinase [Bdellovibrio sp.]|nr:MAG: histidine kinase [Bdellovibrio sp.]
MNFSAKIFDTLLEPVFILDAAGAVTYCNEAASIITDISARKVVRSKMKLLELVQFEGPVQALIDIEKVTDPTAYQEISFTTGSGRTGRVQLTVQRIGPESAAASAAQVGASGTSADASGKNWLVFFRDVTLEETLQRKYRGELEKKENVIRDLEVAQAKLEDYSRNLESMVLDRTARLSTLNSQMKALLDSLEQGFLIFDRNGKCLDIVSRACQKIFMTDPRGRPIGEILRLESKPLAAFNKWMAAAFADLLPWEDMAPLAPATFHHPLEKQISLSYYPLRNDQSAIDGIVLVATDITTLVEAQRTAEVERSYAKMVLQIVRQKRQIQNFVYEGERLIADTLMLTGQHQPAFDEAFRCLHTLKGGAASFSIGPLVEAAHTCEEILLQWRDNPNEEILAQLRIKTQELPRLLEQFIDEFKQISGKSLRQDTTREVSNRQLTQFYHQLSSQPELRKKFLETFLFETAEEIFRSTDDLLFKIASDLGKQVCPLEIEPAEFLLWSRPYKRLFSTFVHAFRNSLGHGIETTKEREDAKKSPWGRVGLHIQRTSPDTVRFIIWDDGRGIDPAQVRRKLAEKGIPHESKSDEEVIQQVFEISFSTADTVTQLSGRGVGMDAILSAARELGGTARVESEPGLGSQLIIEVPWLEEDL